MKYLLSIITVTILSIGTLFSQTIEEEVEYYQNVFGMEKKALVMSFIRLEGKSKDAFWDVYDQYETERKTLGKNRIVLLTDYVENYDKLSDKKIDDLITRMMAQKTGTDKLIYEYYDKVKAAAGSKAAGQFIQIEIWVLAYIRASIFENVPFIGELDKEKKN